MSAAVVAMTLDQAVGIARAVTRAHVLVGTQLTGARVRRLGERLGERLGKPAVVIDPRPDLLSPEWRALLRRGAYVVVADPRFRPLVHAFVAGMEGAHDVRVLVAGRDDLSAITPDVPTYVTEAARQQLGSSRLPGRLVATVRTLCDESVRALAEALVRHNLAARPARPARRPLRR